MENNLLYQAKIKMADDMKSRGIGAIIWSIPDAGFHFIPELVINDAKGNSHTVRVTGLYLFDNDIYAIEEDVAKISVNQFYTHGVDIPPVVVTLTENKANEVLGTPSAYIGVTNQGTLEEWITIADCYFEALREQ